jgi:SAM-dependent methyltransferase
VDFLLNLIGSGRKNILEVCCGSGRILVPLAKAGHLATGFDIDEYMMEKLEGKAEGLSNIKWYHNDAVKDDWGNGYDVTVLAGNILINIETDMDYKEAQELFLQKAYDNLNKGGYLYLDFNLFMHPEKFFQSDEERVIFEGTDHSGNHGILKIKKGFYDPGTQISYSDSNITLRMATGEIITKDYKKVKHIPTLENVNAWLSDTGFKIIKIFGDYHGGEINEQTGRAIIWAEK